VETIAPSPVAISPSERNKEDILASHLIGVGATRKEERSLAIAGQLETTPVSTKQA